MKKLIVLLFMILPLGVVAQEVKIAYVKTQEVFMAMPEVSDMEKQMADLNEKYKKELEQMQEEYQKKYSDFIAQQDSLTENIKLRRMQEIQDIQGLLRVVYQLFPGQTVLRSDRFKVDIQPGLLQESGVVVENQGRIAHGSAVELVVHGTLGDHGVGEHGDFLIAEPLVEGFQISAVNISGHVGAVCGEHIILGRLVAHEDLEVFEDVVKGDIVGFAADTAGVFLVEGLDGSADAKFLGIAHHEMDDHLIAGAFSGSGVGGAGVRAGAAAGGKAESSGSNQEPG